MKEFSVKARLPVINENCPACFESPKERARVKKVLATQESLWPNLYGNVRNALRPLMNDTLQKALHGESAFRKALHVRPEHTSKDKAKAVAAASTATESGIGTQRILCSGERALSVRQREDNNQSRRPAKRPKKA